MRGEAWLKTPPPQRTCWDPGCPLPQDPEATKTRSPQGVDGAPPSLPEPWGLALPLRGTGPDLGEAVAEAREHRLHVAPLLHGDDPQVVLLVNPHQEGLTVIVPGGGEQSSRLPGQGSRGTSRNRTSRGAGAGHFPSR